MDEFQSNIVLPQTQSSRDSLFVLSSQLLIKEEDGEHKVYDEETHFAAVDEVKSTSIELNTPNEMFIAKEEALDTVLPSVKEEDLDSTSLWGSEQLSVREIDNPGITNFHADEI